MKSSDISIAFETYSRVALPEGPVHLGCLQQTSMVTWSSQSLVLISFLGFFANFIGKSYIVLFIMCLLNFVYVAKLSVGI